jgi:hypothetical protein
MSRENIEVVQRALSHFQETQRLPEELFVADFILDVSTFQGWPGEQQFIGMGGFEAFFGGWVEPYTEWVMETEEVREAGPAQVIATFRQRGRLRESGSWVELRAGLVYTLAAGLIQRLQVYTPPEDALEAVGLSE